MTPRVVWVTGEVPDVRLGGGSIRQAHLLKAVAAATETHLVAAGEVRDESIRRTVASLIEVDAAPLRRPASRTRRRVEDLTRAITDGRSPEVIETSGVAAALAPAVESLLRPGDIVQVEHTGLGPLIGLRANQPTSWAITLHTVESERIAHRLAIAPSRRHLWALKRERAKALAHEREVIGNYDAVWVTSPDDAGALPHASEVVPNGVDTEAFAAQPLPGGDGLVFTGTLDYLPNIDGLRWFCEYVLPLVRRDVPNASLTIVGRRPAAEVRALASGAVRIEANVDDVRPFLAEARVAVVPLRIGSGTRLKALEAMAVGRPVVGTTIGLAGLGASDRVHALIADGARDFAAAVVALLRDDSLAKGIAGRARKMADQFSWSAISAEFVRQVLAVGRKAAAG